MPDTPPKDFEAEEKERREKAKEELEAKKKAAAELKPPE